MPDPDDRVHVWRAPWPTPETPEPAACHPDCPSWGVEDPCVHPTHTRPETPETAKVPRTCLRCDHHSLAHDAGECWAEVEGRQCRCSWYTPAPPETAMRPEDVPDEWIKTYATGATASLTEGAQDYISHGLAAVLPAHEAMVRAKVAEEVEPILTDLRKAARTHHYTLACEGTDAALGRLRAVLARGEQP